MLRGELPNLASLIEGHFYEGWRRQFVSAEGAISGFVKECDLPTSEAAVGELDTLLHSGLSAQELDHALLHDLACHYDPRLDGYNVDAWLRWVRDRLRQEIAAARERRVFAPGPGMRMLHFPEDRALGWLNRRESTDVRPPTFGIPTSIGYPPAWPSEFYSAARGDIVVPRDEELELIIVDGGGLDPSPLPVQRWNPEDQAAANALPRPVKHDPLDLSPLRDLPPDGLFGLNISGTTLLPHGLAPLQGLTGLRLLFLFQMEIGDGDVAYLEGLSHLEVLTIVSFQLTDEGVKSLAGLRSLRYLALDRQRITDAGLWHLRHCSHLEELNLSWTRVGEDDLPWLADMHALRQINLNATRVTDAGLMRLSRLSGLQWIFVSSPFITARGEAALQAALPHCRVITPLSLMSGQA